MFSFFTSGLSRLSPTRAARSAIGIDLGSHAIKAIQVERPPTGRPRIVATLCHARAADAGPNLSAQESAELKSSLHTAGFTGADAVLSAPSEQAMVGPLELPPKNSAAPLDQIARMETARNFRCAPDSFELGWWELPAGIRSGRGTHAMAAGLPHTVADALLDSVEKPTGLHIRAIDISQTALIRAVSPALATNGVTGILDLGKGPATLSLVHKGVLTFSRRISEASVGQLHAAFCRELAVESDVADYLLSEVGFGPAPQTPADEGNPVELPDAGRRLLATFLDNLVKELSLSLGYASHQYPDAEVARLLLVGTGATLAGLGDRLATMLGVEVQQASPATLADCPSGLLADCSAPGLTLALGLALWGE